MRRVLALCASLALFGSAACETESPVEIGEDLLPGESVTSFEVVLQPGQFLVLDSAFSLYSRNYQAPAQYVADAFDGVLTARALARFSPLPRSISVVDSVTNALASDTLPTWEGGRFVVLVDTLRSTHADAQFAVYRVAEAWDPITVTWEMRIDTTGVQEAWTQPGATLGARVGEAVWTRGEGDTLNIELSADDVVALRDSADARLGFVLVTETAGARMRINSIGFEADARSSRADTVVTVNGIGAGRTFIYTPELTPRSDAPRVGGIPAWRTLMRLSPDLRDVEVPCPDRPGCTIRLGDSEITLAMLEYQLAAPPPGFVPDDSVRLAAVPLLEAPGVPFARSLLGSVASAVPSDRWIQVEEFDDVASAAPVRLPITFAIRSLLPDDAENIGIALVPAVPLGTLGFVPLEPNPVLRLVLTVSEEVQLQ